MKGTIDVKSSAGTYEVTVGHSLLDQNLKQIKENCAESCFLFVDENVWTHHKNQLAQSFKSAGFKYQVRIIPAGEKSKSIQQWIELVDYLLQSGVRRNTPLFAIGGGVTGDLAGFVASATMRGIPLFHLPTTLLAMVDSSIGGKTGINHSTGKNLIGSFYQPIKVIADVAFLETLPEREWTNGLSEILKYGAISDRRIFDDAEIFLNGEIPLNHTSDLTKLILKCAEIKIRIVESDEFEAGTRAYLNFGHTFAHALEKAADYKTLSHGEAVYLGMLAAITLSNLNGAEIDGSILRRFRNLYSFQISPKTLQVNKLLKTMKLDKKVVDENYRFVLLKDWQQPYVSTVNNVKLINDAWLTILHELR